MPSASVTAVLVFIGECNRRHIFHHRVCIACFLCATCVLEVQAPSSSIGYLCVKFCFSGSLIVELAHGEKSHTKSTNQPINQSIARSPSLFDSPGTKAFALEQIIICRTEIEQTQQYYKHLSQMKKTTQSFGCSSSTTLMLAPQLIKTMYCICASQHSTTDRPTSLTK